MITLTNNNLHISLLDPVADSSRLGVRYCTGGYIFQIEDADLGPLLSGPTYPDSFNWFDGQGIPDAFNLSHLPLSGDAGQRRHVLIPGIGICDIAEKKIVESCSWEIVQEDASAKFTTRQQADDWSFTLEKEVILLGRTVRTTAAIHNSGTSFIPLRWFPHPFFPQLPEGNDELIRINTEISLPNEADYTLTENGFIVRKNWPWTEGHGHALDHSSRAPLVVIQLHPLLGQVSAHCSYIPDFFSIWGNGATFSWEPYLERTVAGGQSFSWWIDYQF